jgi:hypothetical protein
VQVHGYAVEPAGFWRGRRDASEVARARVEFGPGADQQQPDHLRRRSASQSRRQVPAVRTAGEQVGIIAENRPDSLADGIEDSIGVRLDRRRAAGSGQVEVDPLPGRLAYENRLERARHGRSVVSEPGEQNYRLAVTEDRCSK